MTLHEIKEPLILFLFIFYFGYGLIKTTHEKYDAKYICIYRYSIPFFLGIGITGISIIGLVLSFYYNVEYAPWLLISIFGGIWISSYGNCFLSKYKGKEREYHEGIQDLKKMAIYFVLVVAILIMRIYFI